MVSKSIFLFHLDFSPLTIGDSDTSDEAADVVPVDAVASPTCPSGEVEKLQCPEFKELFLSFSSPLKAAPFSRRFGIHLLTPIVQHSAALPGRKQKSAAARRRFDSPNNIAAQFTTTASEWTPPTASSAQRIPKVEQAVRRIVTRRLNLSSPLSD